ncbi:MAG: hypothetical protein CL570_07335 [Alphaproteobacteria bacterium]|nr:hypothetical protein [Alphaproteobacteria bacterium]HCQ71069.1 hypothetical protein [Rhodospirillaceae bacterium]|tara:strand:+ start:9989 stop:10333 length:345 start_codon:yes stop_codon:yes gene_type:complete
MTFRVIDNPSHKAHAGFKAHQFRMLDALYLQGVSQKTLSYRTVECDFDAGTASYTYYKSQQSQPFLQFIIRKVGPHTVHFELYKTQKGRIAKSGLFERTYNKLVSELESLGDSA